MGGGLPHGGPLQASCSHCAWRSVGCRCAPAPQGEATAALAAVALANGCRPPEHPLADPTALLGNTQVCGRWVAWEARKQESCGATTSSAANLCPRPVSPL